MRRRQFSKTLAAGSGFARKSLHRARPGARPQSRRAAALGVQAGIGQDCHRGVQASAVLKELGLPALEIMNGDTESNVDVARARAERLISEGAQLLVGAFDSGRPAIAQVAEQRGIPLVINIAAAPPITEQGYKFVFRNFPTAPMILGDAFANQPKCSPPPAPRRRAACSWRNDTFGVAMQKGFTGVMSKFQMPYKVVDTIAYDPAARDLSVEVAKAKASGADALVMVSRLNDAILITRELVKQRWSPMSVLSMGPGWYDDQYLKTLASSATGRSASCRGSTRTRSSPSSSRQCTSRRIRRSSLNTNHVYTFEALLVAADAFKRAGSTDPKALADAIRTTSIKDNVSPAPASSSTPRARTTS